MADEITISEVEVTLGLLDNLEDLTNLTLEALDLAIAQRVERLEKTNTALRASLIVEVGDTAKEEAPKPRRRKTTAKADAA